MNTHFKHGVLILIIACIILIVAGYPLIAGQHLNLYISEFGSKVRTGDIDLTWLQRFQEYISNRNTHVSQAEKTYRDKDLVVHKTIESTHFLAEHGHILELSNSYIASSVALKENKLDIEIKAVRVCDEKSRKLVGVFNVDVNVLSSVMYKANYSNIEPGGAWRPTVCHANRSTAIVIPYRDRARHLEVLLYYLIPMLQRQQIDFRIFVVEQSGKREFNQGLLENAGFIEASKHKHFDCVIFHDVDMIPENDYNLYTCEDMPIHMCPALDKFNYQLPYPNYVGAVLQIPTKVFLELNGYSNSYWGWGGEDDDMHERIMAANKSVLRPPFSIGRYQMIKHINRTPSLSR